MEKIPKKIHVLAYDIGEGLIDIIYLSADKLKIPIELNLNPKEGIQKLPKDYDIYFLHLSQIEESDLKNIRDNQPWSYFVGSSGAFGLSEDIKKLFDEIFYVMDIGDIENILKEKGNLTDRI